MIGEKETEMPAENRDAPVNGPKEPVRHDPDAPIDAPATADDQPPPPAVETPEPPPIAPPGTPEDVDEALKQADRSSR